MNADNAAISTDTANAITGMGTIPAGIIAEPLYNLAALLASSPAFQTWTGTANPADALARVHVIEPNDGAVPHPFAVIKWQHVRWTAQAGGIGLQHIASGDMSLLIEDAIDPANINLSGEPAYVFSNNLGAVITDLLANAGTSGFLYMPTISLDEAPARMSESYLGNPGDFFQAHLTAEWGLT